MSDIVSSLLKLIPEIAVDFIPGGETIKSIAKAVAGVGDDDEAENRILQDQTLQLEYQKAILLQAVEMAKVDRDRTRDELDHAEEEIREFNSRIKDMEGTAAELKDIPFFGKLIILLRGVQRPLWGLFTLFSVYMVFSGAWDIGKIQQGSELLFAMVIMVFIFLYGERAVKNILPILSNYLGIPKTNGK